MNMHRAVGFVGVVGTMLLGACFADEGDMPYPGDADNGTGGGGLAGTSETSSGVGGQSGAGGDMSIAASTSSSGGGGTGGGGTRIPCVPTDNDLGDCLGIFVDFKADDLGDGSRDTPYNTWQKAFDDPQAASLPILMCEGTKNTAETVAIGDSVDVWGGLDCDTWKLNPGKTTGINAPPGKVGVIIETAGESILRGLAISAPDAQDPGSSSIGMIIEGGKVDLENCSISAGGGAPGAPGEAPGGAAPGVQGNVGAKSIDCAPSAGGGVNPGGPATSLDCGNGVTSGGDGGVSGVDAQGALYASAGDAGSGAYALFGLGGSGAGTDDCNDGHNGDVGSNGNDGPGGLGIGTIAVDGYHGEPGTAGDTGSPGGGGGGGGASLGNGCIGVRIGASGGAGGTGGCGGLGGGGGGAGGSSIAILSLNADLTITGGYIAWLSGGDGGLGQSGGTGGAGADGSVGGNGAGNLKDGCKGGKGGQGGTGGPGGGGQGGHSLGVAFMGPAPELMGTMVVPFPTAGKGGVGGNSGMNDGDPGLAYQMLSFDDGTFVP